MEARRRILLKLSGEMLAGPDGRGLADEAIAQVATEVAETVARGTQVALVLGAGNLVRGAGPNRSPLAVEQQRLDTMGMLATAINCTAVTDRLRQAGLEAVHLAAFPGIPFTELAAADGASSHLDQGRVVVFSGGTGLPFFSTDTAATVRALQVGADALLKGTQVKGVFDQDPRRHAQARFLPRVDYGTALSRQLGFMDRSALALASQHRLTIVVFDAHQHGNIGRAVAGTLECSVVGPD